MDNGTTIIRKMGLVLFEQKDLYPMLTRIITVHVEVRFRLMWEGPKSPVCPYL
jgi:hypothetical protein